MFIHPGSAGLSIDTLDEYQYYCLARPASILGEDLENDILN